MCKQSEHSEGAAQDGTTLISVGRAAQKKKKPWLKYRHTGVELAVPE